METQKPRRIIDNKYIIKKRIGNGAQGEIFLVNKIGDNNEYVVKIIHENKVSAENKINFVNEIEILKILSNQEKKYVPYLFDFGEGFVKKEGENVDESGLVKRLYLVIDYAANRDLFYYLIITDRGFKELHAKMIFKKILEGIQYCHEKNICHLDIKIENILLDEKYDPKITDFGFAQKISDSKGIPLLKNSIVGTPRYICPEIWLSKPYKGIDADIFSLGVVLFNLMTGNFGFELSVERDPFYNLIRRKFDKKYWNKIGISISRVSELSEEFKNLYMRMVSFIPDKRPSIKEILNDPWMKEINDMNEDQLEQLNLEIIDEFMKLKDKKDKLNETFESNQNSDNLDFDTNSRGASLEQMFKENIKIKKIKKGEKFADHFIKIKGDINPYNFMNDLLDKIKSKYEDCFIEVSKEKMIFEVIFEIEQEIEEKIEQENEQENEQEIENDIDFGDIDNSCVIKIKMYEDEEGGFFVNFIKKKGDIENYYKLFLEIKGIIKNILN